MKRSELAALAFILGLGPASTALAAPPAAATEEARAGGIVRALNGDGLKVFTPPGWVLDTKAMAAHGIDMLFYPEATGFNGFNEGTPVFAYVMPTYKGAPHVSVKGLIDMRTGQLAGADSQATTTIEQPARADT
ncbi:MAG TPA: hypothetical protein VFV15_03480, partial [Moraxellaceae bacterium]|nr:hypothetical protein [Moraxellaceae bacterium]